MNARTKAALLWGAVGALSFLVLVQAYRLLDFGALPIGAVAIGAVLVFVGATLLTYVAGP